MVLARGRMRLSSRVLSLLLSLAPALALAGSAFVDAVWTAHR